MKTKSSNFLKPQKECCCPYIRKRDNKNKFSTDFT